MKTQLNVFKIHPSKVLCCSHTCVQCQTETSIRPFLHFYSSSASCLSKPQYIQIHTYTYTNIRRPWAPEITMFCSEVIMTKTFKPIKSRRPCLLILISFTKTLLVVGHSFFTPGLDIFYNIMKSSGVSVVQWLSHESNTLKVPGSIPGRDIIFKLFTLVRALIKHRRYMYCSYTHTTETQVKLSLQCSGYHMSLTHSRSLVQSQAETILCSFYIPQCKHIY